MATVERRSLRAVLWVVAGICAVLALVGFHSRVMLGVGLAVASVAELFALER